MGFMYKLMKHRYLPINLVASSAMQTNRILTVEGHIIEKPNINQNNNSSSNNNNDNDNIINHNRNIKDLEQGCKEQDEDKEFTAEHILQLCKFLADKSKGNKNLHKQQQSPKKVRRRCKGIHTSVANSKINHENVILMTSRKEESTKKVGYDVMTTANCLSNQFGQTVLTTRFITNNNNNNIEPEREGREVINQGKQLVDGKRDILLKIRHQIYERRKLREQHYQSAVLHPIQVWRPW